MNLRVSILGSLPPIKGTSPYTLNLIKELSKNAEIDFYGFKSIYPEIFYPGGTKTDEPEPKLKNVHIFNYLNWYNPLSWIKTGFAINTEVLHVQWWAWALAPIYWIVLKIAKLRGKRIIMTIHNVKMHEPSRIAEFFNRTVINLADEYIVHSENNKQSFLKEFNFNKPVNVIPHGPIEIKKSNLSTVELRMKYGFLRDEKVLLFFGNIRPYKGLDILLRAFAKIEDKKVKLIVAGNPMQDWNYYQKIIDDLKLSNRIKLFLKYLPEDELAELLQFSDIVVFPYIHFDASSGAVALASSFGKNIVVTDVGGMPEMVKNKKLIAHSGDVNDLKRKLLCVLNKKNMFDRKFSSFIKKSAFGNIATLTLRRYKYEEII